MKKTIIVFINSVILGFVLIACPNESVPIPEPEPVLENVEYCQLAQSNLEQLGCIAKDKPYTVKGKSFKQFCEETLSSGIDLNPRCISRITNCQDINKCAQKK